VWVNEEQDQRNLPLLLAINEGRSRETSLSRSTTINNRAGAEKHPLSRLRERVASAQREPGEGGLCGARPSPALAALGHPLPAARGEGKGAFLCEHHRMRHPLHRMRQPFPAARGRGEWIVRAGQAIARGEGRQTRRASQSPGQHCPDENSPDQHSPDQNCPDQHRLIKIVPPNIHLIQIVQTNIPPDQHSLIKILPTDIHLASALSPSHALK